MLDINLLRKQLDDVVARLATRPFEFPVKEFNALEMTAKLSKSRLKNFRLCVIACPSRSVQLARPAVMPLI